MGDNFVRKVTMMFVLVNSEGKMFSSIKKCGGQPMAVGTNLYGSAKQFPTEKKAERYQKLWLGSGVGMESFGKILPFEIQ